MNDHSLRPDRAVTAGGRTFPVAIRRHPRARRYVIRMTPTGEVRLTVPRGASIGGGLAFAQRQQDWIAKEWQRLERNTAAWGSGSELWFRGERVRLSVVPGPPSPLNSPDPLSFVELVDHRIPLLESTDVRSAVERFLRELAAAELPARLTELVADRQLPPVRVSVRNQRSRWGSCSSRGSIALNWRLIQMPSSVSDYIMLHELAHRRQPNHSPRFWREVDGLCPWWRDSERWLRRYGKDLL
jgi:predicted metal-dependent hydrolase